MPKLIFVYNAEAGFVNGMLDSLHKTFYPSTYPCKLCAITYGLFTMKSEWKEFIDSMAIEKEFLHKSELFKNYPDFASIKLPAILLQDEKIEVIISADEFELINNIAELKSILSTRLQISNL